ncbi:peptidase m20 [Paramyrothecium foliicola]|nr:peptidase m20 [Paramyrothecium foliicola]
MQHECIQIPPILAALATNPFLLDLCDLSSVKSIVTGAGGLSKELNEGLEALPSTWTILSGKRSILPGSSGILLPQYRACLVDIECNEIEGYNQAGELLLQSSSTVRGYVGDVAATKSLFDAAGWLKTGGVGIFQPGPDDTEHLFIADRLKDTIQLKGIQVIPTEIEAHSRRHPDISDAAIVSVKDARDGERAKAFIILSPSGAAMEGELNKEIAKHGVINSSEGMDRLALSKADKAVCDWFVRETRALGCEVSMDTRGNLFAVYPSESSDRPPIGMDSHLDTQPAGGKYDGILGVLAAVEVIRTLREAGIKTWCPMAAVVWTNEEGAAFFPGCSGSSVWAGWVALANAYDQKHCVTGQSLGAALDEIDARGVTITSSHANPLQAHFELYIEQGKPLESFRQSIGVVRHIQGIRRYAITCNGRQEHEGTVRVKDRADALVAASRIVRKWT